MSNSEERSSADRPVRARSPVPLDRCGMAQAAGLLGDRWSLLILREAFYGVVRFADMQADLGAPKAALSQHLTALVDAGLLKRFDYREGSARVRQGYRLSERGRGLAIVFLAMKQWWDEGQDDEPSVHFVPEGQKTAVRVILADNNNEPVSLRDIQVRLL